MNNKTWYLAIMMALTAVIVYDILYPLMSEDTRITAVHGTYDLRSWDIDSTPIVSLNGEWNYTSGTTDELDSRPFVPRTVPAPFIPDAYANDTAGVYHLTILLPPGSQKQSYALNVESVFAAHTLLVNGTRLMQLGGTDTQGASWYALNRPYIVHVFPDHDRITIAMIVENQRSILRQGIIRHIQFGDRTALTTKFRLKDNFEFAFASLFFLIGAILFLVRSSLPNYRGTVYLACFLIGLACFIVTAAPTHKLFYDFFPLHGAIAYSMQMRIYYLSIVSYIFFLLFVDQLFPLALERGFLRSMVGVGVAMVAIVFVVPVYYLSLIEPVFFLYRFCVLIGFTVMMYRILRNDTSTVPYNLILLYFSLFTFTAKNLLYYLRFNDATQSPYIELAVAVAVMVHIVIQTYRNVQQEQLKLALAFHNARIKPHFLFNALNSIHEAIYDEPAVAQKLLLAFSQFLRNRFRFSDFSALVPLSEEMDILDAYLHIEHDRFRERINIAKEIDAESLGCLVPQLFLQPLVENAIHHGVLKHRTGGNVVLKIGINAQMLFVEVHDTGVGMSPERVQQILQGGLQDSIGVYNIHSRLKYLYGVGLSIESMQGIGTIVRCKIPIERTISP